MPEVISTRCQHPYVRVMMLLFELFAPLASRSLVLYDSFSDSSTEPSTARSVPLDDRGPRREAVKSPFTEP